MKTNKQIAEQYFNAFHNGKLNEVFTYLSKNAVIKYGAEAPVDAKLFFPQSAEMIAGLEFITHGIYNSESTNNIIIHFSFFPKNNREKITEAIDIIMYDDSGKIKEIKVIPNN